MLALPATVLESPTLAEVASCLPGARAGQRPGTDVALLIGVVLVLWSGLPIARVIDFSWMGFERESMRFWRTMHTSFSMIVLVLIGVHLGLHWRWVLARLGWR